MKKFISNFFKKNKILKKQNTLPQFATISYSQYAEDLVLKSFISKNNGFYVDIGAHHPQRFSNTYIFYLEGWKGINVDATPNSMIIFNTIRPRDINIEIGISKNAENLFFYQFNESAINTFSEELANTYINRGEKLIKKHLTKTITLEELFDNYLPQNQNVDILTIDAEGLDIDILKSNNWEKYCPDFIVLELWINSVDSIVSEEIYKFLTSKKYILVAKTLCSIFFKKLD